MKQHLLKLALVSLFAACSLICLRSQEQSNPAQGGTAQQPQKPLRVRVSESVAQGLIAKKVQPDYPREAREKRVQGLVVLKVEISPEGDVTDLSLVSGHPLLVPAAIDAVKQWKYKPYLLNGQAVTVETQVSVSFRLPA
jgi:protein TonB